MENFIKNIESVSLENIPDSLAVQEIKKWKTLYEQEAQSHYWTRIGFNNTLDERDRLRKELEALKNKS